MATLDAHQTDELAARLTEAFRQGRTIAPLTQSYPDLDLDDAYAVQQQVVAHALRSGARPTGRKIGLTSEAMQRQMGVDQPDYGVLLSSMLVEDGALPPAALLQPRVEAEIAFRLHSPLRGEVTVEDVLRATDSVYPAIEVIDSRIDNWRITLPDTVADNASSGVYVLGPPAPATIHLPDVCVVLEEDGIPVADGTGAAALGDPGRCVAWLASALGRHGAGLEAGDVVLSGALHASVAALPGRTYRAHFDRLGSVSVRFPADDHGPGPPSRKDR